MGAYRHTTDPDVVVAYIRRALADDVLVGADTETMGFDGSQQQTKATDRWHAQMVGFSLSAKWGEGLYVPINHDDGNCPDTPELRAALADLVRSGKTCWHGAHFDAAIICRWLDIPISQFRPAHCTLLMAQSLGERSEIGKDTAGGLKPLAKKYLGVERPAFNELWPEEVKAKDRRFASLDPDTATAYAAADADDVLGLVSALSPQLDKWQVANIYGMEMQLLPEVLWMEEHGVMLDQEYAQRCSDELTRFIEQATKAIYDRIEERLGRPATVTLQRTRNKQKVMVEEPLKLSSNDSLAALLFGDPNGFQYPPLKLTPKQKPSVDEDVLERLAIQEDWLGWLLEVRAAEKVRGTYVDTFATYCLPEQNEDGTERLVLHPNYKQFGAETGRTASDRPNVQNLPKEQKIGAKKDGTWVVPGVEPVVVNTRDMFIPRPGFYYVDMDWSAVEYRIIGGYSQDPGLIETFRRGIDIHVATYALMYGVNPESVDDKQRSEGKTLNYAINFGAGPERLAGMLGCTVADAKAKMAAYNAGFPLVTAWKASIEEFAKTHKYVQTIFGRKRWLHFGGQGVADSLARKMYFAALREAVNCPVQGTAADLLKITLLRLGPWLREHYPEVRTVLTTHDSITFEVPLSIPPEVFIPAARPLVEFPEDWQPGWPAITADFVHGTIGWGSLKEEGEEATAPEPATEPAAPLPEPQEATLAPAAPTMPRELHLRCLEPVTTAQVEALVTFLNSRPGPDRMVLEFPNDGGQTFHREHIGISPDDRAAVAEITGWVQFHLEYPAAVVAGAVAETL